MASEIEDAILSQLAAAGPGKSIDPMNVAKQVQPERWQRLLPVIKREAVTMARQGVIVILRHNKPADPGDFRGVYRIRLPIDGDPPISAE